MRRDLSTLRIDKVIIHDVPARRVSGGAAPPVLSDIESPLTLELRNYFREKIAGSLISASFDVTFDPQSDSPVPSLVLDNLGSETTDYVAMSKAVAEHLYNCQTGANSPGLLIIAQGLIEGTRSLAILKLEKEQGLRIQQIQHDGRNTFSLEHVRDLMLTDTTRIFKVGLFAQTGATVYTIEGSVSDKQRGNQPSTAVADFFLKRFLGCRLCEAAEVTTQRFFQVSQRFINEGVTDPTAKARYEIALLAALNSTTGTLSPRVFAEQNLGLDDRQRYIEFLARSDVPTEHFQKATELIEGQLGKIQVAFQSGVAVLASPEAFEQRVRMTTLENGLTKMEIEDRLASVRRKR